MIVSFSEDESHWYFIVSDTPAQYGKALKAMFFQALGPRQVKAFPKTGRHFAQDLGAIQSNFARTVKTIFMQLSDIEPIPWEEALSEFALIVKDQEIDWWIVGSCALAVRGVSVSPHDLDIMVAPQDLDTVVSLFSDSIVEPFHETEDWVVQFYGSAFLGALIAFASSPQTWVDRPQPTDFGLYAMEHLEDIVWRGTRIRIPPLDLQLDVNKRRGRTQTVRAIEDFIRRHSR